MNVEIRPIKQIKTAKYNPRLISDQQLASLKASIERFGFVDPVIVNDRTGTLVGGHQRIKAAKDLGLKEVPVVSVNLDEADEKALNVALNKISGEWDLDLLRGVLEDVQAAGLDLSLTGFTDGELEAMLAGETGEGEGEGAKSVNYSRKVEAPVYHPTGPCPSVRELMDDEKCRELVREIEAADLPDDVRGFLLRAAERHVVFNFRNVAEFYAHQSPAIQTLMEASALVIIDYQQAVERGFVKLAEVFAAQYEAEYAE